MWQPQHSRSIRHWCGIGLVIAALAGMLLAPGTPPAAAATVTFYDGALGGTPDTQGFTYLTLAKKTGIAFADRRHFYAYMSQVMRHALIDRARRRNAQKRQRIDEQTTAAESDAIDVLALDQALTRLAETDPRLARVAELRLFADLSSAEIAEVVAVTERTVERDWLKARTFLHACLATGA